MDNVRLRPFRPDDFDAFHAVVSDFDVVQMLVLWPYPAEPEFTRARMNTPDAKAGQVLVIEVNGQLAGSVGAMAGGLAYMLGRKYWGRGIASRAVAGMIDRVFAAPDITEITACVWHGNPASEKVLTKNGFRMVAECEDFCKARGGRLKNNSFKLSRAEWARAQPLKLKTERLVIEPFSGHEAAVLSSLMNDPDIARMMATIPHPFSEQDAAAWLVARKFSHEIGADNGFVAKVSLHNGTLVGFVGIGGASVNTAYAFGRAHWGQGYATEAMRAFLAHCTLTFSLKEITAGAKFDNPASQAVLGKLGFEKVGEKMHRPSGRDAAEMLWLYALKC